MPLLYADLSLILMVVHYNIGQMGIGGVFRNLGGNMVRAFPKQTGLSLVTDRGAPRFIGGIDKSNLAGF